MNVSEIFKGISVWANEGLEKIVKLKTIFKNHINTIRVLSSEFPETAKLRPETREVMVRNSWIALTYLRSCGGCLDDGNSYKGMNGDCHDLNSYITSGLKIDVLRNFVDRIKVLNPTEAELAVLAALALFSPGYRDTKIPPEDSLLLEEYQTALGPILKKLLERDPATMSKKFSSFLSGLGDLRVLSIQQVHHYDKFVHYQPKIFCAT